MNEKFTKMEYVKKCRICGVSAEKRKLHMVTIVRLPPYENKVPICASCLYDICWVPLLEGRLNPECFRTMRKVLSDIVHENGKKETVLYE